MKSWYVTHDLWPDWEFSEQRPPDIHARKLEIPDELFERYTLAREVYLRARDDVQRVIGGE